MTSSGTKLAAELALLDAVRRHDLMYFYSDNIAVVQKGRKSMEHIRELAARLPKATVVRIWNGVVDERLQPEYRATFYWKEE